MSKELKKSTRIQVYGYDLEKKEKVAAYALIGFDYRLQGEPDGSVVTLIRDKESNIEKQLLKYGDFTEEDIETILNMEFKQIFWADSSSMIVRIA